MLGSVYTERQRQSCYLFDDIALIEFLIFDNIPGESLLKWVATSIDQVWCKRPCWHSKSMIDV